MKSTFRHIASTLFITGLSLASFSAQAQNAIGGAKQQGNGAYVQKSTYNECMTNSLLGLPALAATDCVNMTQTKFMVTPSGNVTSVWRGTVPQNARPAQRLVHNSTWTETVNGVTVTYPTHAVTEPNGTVTLTLSQKKVEGYQKAKGKK